MKNLIVLLLLSLSLLAAEEDWKVLFDGKTLEGWTQQNEANWRVAEGVIVVDEGEIGLLTTETVLDAYELELEFRAQIGANSGIFIETKPVVKDESIDCYEVNIAPPSNAFPTGSIVKHKLFEGAGEKEEWRKYRITVKDGHVKVWLDGKMTVEYKDENPVKRGLLGLQKNAGKVEFRNIRIRALE
ncbi:MAG: 3-keto-disaccharide hydrolase [Luteolibacter sp.]